MAGNMCSDVARRPAWVARCISTSPQAFADVAFGGTVGAGEAYIRGLWRCDDLVSLVRIFVANREQMNRPRLRLVAGEPAAADDSFTGPTATAEPAARATSPRTTTWAMSSTSSCSMKPWRIPAPSFRTPDATLAEGSASKVRSRMPQARPQAHRSCARDRHGLGRVRHSRRAALWLPRHHDHYFRRASTDYAERKIAALGLADRITRAGPGLS